VTQLLKLAHLVDDHGMPEMKIGRRGIESHLHTEGPTGCERAVQLPSKLLLNIDLDGPASDHLELLIHAEHSIHALVIMEQRPVAQVS